VNLGLREHRRQPRHRSLGHGRQALARVLDQRAQLGVLARRWPRWSIQPWRMSFYT
jgi:hypothetical protein